MGFLKRAVQSVVKKAVRKGVTKALSPLTKPASAKRRKSKATASPKPTESAPKRTAGENIACNGRAINVDGSHETQIYTYLGVIFKGVKKNEIIYVDVIPDDVTLHSRSTGTTTDTEGFTTALSYNGRIFGTVASSLICLKEMRRAGFEFKLKVKKVGMYSAGLPELKALTIHPSLLKEWWYCQKETTEAIPLPPENVKKIELFFEGGQLPISAERKAVSVETLLIPAPKGSKAKPRIRVVCDGIEAGEVSARSPRYKELEGFVGKAPYSAHYRSYTKDRSDPLHKVVILYDPAMGRRGELRP